MGGGNYNNAELILVGKIVAPYGIKGMLKVKSFSESLTLYSSLNKFLVKTPSSSDFISMEIVCAKYYKNWVRVSFKGIYSRTKADFFIGSKIYVRKCELPLLEDDTYFWSDLIGMSVQSVTGEIIGYIDNIIRTGSNDVYVIKSIDAKSKEILIPAIKSIVLIVDIVSNSMLVDLPDGIRDDN